MIPEMTGKPFFTPICITPSRKRTFAALTRSFLILLLPILITTCGLPDSMVLDAPDPLSFSSNRVGFRGSGDPNIQGYQLFYKIYEETFEVNLINDDAGIFNQSSYTGSILLDQNDFYLVTEADKTNTTQPLILYQGTGDVIIDFSNPTTPVITVPSAADISPGRARNSGSIDSFESFVLTELDIEINNVGNTDFDLLDLRKRQDDAGQVSDPSSFQVAFAVVARGLDPSTLETFYSLPVYLGTIDITS